MTVARSKPRTRRRYLVAVALVLLCLPLLALAYAAQRYSALKDEDVAIALSPTYPDVTYCSPGGQAQLLDLYVPAGEPSAARPVLVYVHGGGWVGGDKRKGSGLVEIPALVEHGYAVAAVNYRLAREHKFPASIEDVKCAVRFLRAHAGTYDLDPRRVGIWGGSAGGHLAALTALAGREAGFDTGEYLDQDSSVVAVVDMFGPSDLTAGDLTWLQQYLLHQAFGDTPDLALLRQASPVNYVTAGAPPFLILHGKVDDAVPVNQSEMLDARLRAAGVASTLVLVDNANHNFAPTSGPINPTRAEITRQVVAFFDTYVK